MEESITLVSVLPEDKMDGFATTDQVICVLTSALHVSSMQLKDFVNPLLQACTKYMADRTLIDMQSWFRLTSTTEFLRQVSVVSDMQMIEGRGPTSNIRLFRTALYLFTKEYMT
jgi:hypothetical protein